MKKIQALAALMVLSACAAPPPSATGTEVTSLLSGEVAARQHCLMMMAPHIPPGMPALDSKVTALPDAPNGDKVLRLLYTYGTTKVRMDARCNYSIQPDGRWQFSRLTISPRYPAPPAK